MNKRKFEKKCQELYAYEDEMLKKMSEYVKPINEDLNKNGYKVVPRLLWFYPNESDENKELVTSRKDICYKKAYVCSMNVVVCPIESNVNDETEEKCGISLNDWATVYSLSIWRGWSFRRGKCSYIFKHLSNVCIEVKMFGLDYVRKKYKIE